MADKSYADLAVATDLQDADLVASYRGPSGPLKTVTWALIKSTLQTALGSVFARTALNLSDLANVAQARSNLGLGQAATLNIGQNTGQVAAGDDSRFAANANAAAAAQATANTANTTANAALPASRLTSGPSAPGTLAAGVVYLQYTP